MTDEKKLDNNQPETAKPVTVKKSSEAKEKKQQPKLGSSNKGIAIIALIISITTASGGAFYIYNQNKLLKQQVANLSSQLNDSQQQITDKLASTEQSTKEIVHKAQTALEQQQKSIESMQLAIADVKGRRPNDWLLAEADYLVKLAGRQLFLEHDIVTATTLMQGADQRIAALNDPILIPLRKVMANDITKLKSLPLLDRDGLALQLISLQTQVDSLPLANTVLPEAKEETKETVSSNPQEWQHNLKASLKNFSDNFITFRVRNSHAKPLLTPQQHFYLRENIKGKLDTAIKATYSEQKEIYQTSLKVADEWSQAYFDQEDPAVQQFHSSIDKLSKIKIDIQYPNKFETSQMLSDIIRERLRKEVTTIGTEEK